MAINAQKSLNVIIEYSKKLADNKDYFALERLLIDFAKEITEADRGTVWLCDESSKTLYTQTADEIEGYTVPFGQGIIGWAIDNKQSIMSNNVHQDPHFYKDIEEKSGYVVTSTIVVPFKNPNGDIVGALQVLNAKAGSFDTQDLELAELVVTFTTSMLNNIFLNFQINRIFDYTARVADETAPEKIFPLLAEMGRDFIRAERATIWLADKEQNHLSTYFAHGLDALSIPVNKGIVGDAYIKGESIICNDPYHDTRFNADIDRESGFNTKSIIAIPLKTKDNVVIGALQCVNKMGTEAEFTYHDTIRLKMISSYIANTLEVAGLYQEIEDTQKEIIFRLGNAGEFRSRETGHHVKRVAEYSGLLADLYGLEFKEAELIRIASPMHDIGKIAIPDEVLNKPGKLTSEEFEIMKKHSQFGYEILSGSKRPILNAAAIIAREHHEKWDGTGYPQGKKGEDIHIYGRITALADVFDALGSDRCYKKAWELEKILNLINEQKGQHFDPCLVELFMKHLNKFLIIRDRLQDIQE